jgi:hypothetical protein
VVGDEVDDQQVRAGFREVARTHDAATVRAWARSAGIEVSPTGGLPRFVYELYLAARDR